MNSLLRDLRYALRSLGKNPGFTAVAIATLALGIGANTAIFSVVRAVLLKPLGFPHPERLVTLEERGSDGKPSLTGFPTYQDWRARAKSFEDVAVLSYWNPTLAPDGFEPEKLEGMRVSDGFFRMLGVRPFIGRDFQAYLPHEQFTDSDMVIVIRTSGDPASLAPAARAAIRSVDPAQPITRVMTVEQVVSTSAASRLFAASLLTAFSVLAVLLSAVGVFGVVSGFVTRRVREIGIRIALGAGRGQILYLVAGQALALAAAGVAAAIPLALGLGRALESQLYDVSPGDAVLLAAVAALAITVALAASLLPARRATRIDPIAALRSE